MENVNVHLLYAQKTLPGAMNERMAFERKRTGFDF